MIASTWYCIAQTSTFDTGCTINVAFDGYDIQFSASVKFGMSAINITRCNIPYDTVFSLRLREGASQWFVDIFCSKEITPNVSIADSPYWTEVNTTAGAGNIILSLNDITSKYNTEQGGGTGGLDIDQLKRYLDDNGYTEAKNFWSKEGDETIRTRHNIVVDKGGAFGRGSETNITFGRLDNWEDWDASTMMFYTLSASLGVNLNERLKYIEQNGSGLNEDDLRQYLTSNNYLQEADIADLRVTVKGLDDILNGNVGGVIDTWNEVVSFLDGYSQSDDLAAILSGMNTDIANRVLIEDFEKLEEAVNPLFGYFDANGNANNALKLGGHSADYFATADALNTHIKAFNTYKTTTDDRLNKLEDLWYMDAEGNVHTTHNIVVDKGGAFGMGAESGDVPSASVSIKFEDSTIVYSPVDGIITLPAYPSEGGGVADSVDWAKVTGKPTTLSGYGITDAAGAGIAGGDGFVAIPYTNNQSVFIYYRGGFDWRVTNEGWVNSYRLLHEGNYSNYALPLSGGIITGPLNISSNNDDKIILNNTDAETNFQFISFRQNGVQYGSLGTSFDGILEWNGNDIIHSGNIGSQSVNYASSAGNADTLGGYSNSSYFAYRGWSDQNANEAKMGSYFTYSNNAPRTGPLAVFGVDGYDLQLNAPYMDDNYYLSFRTRNGDYGYYNPWVTLARVDGNVASATKLQTARKIWGQSFDGTQNVSGKLSNATAISFDTDCGVYQGSTFSGSMSKYDIAYYGTNHYFHNFSSGYNLIIKENGNVLIGTTTDWGYKLGVYGATFITGNGDHGILIGAGNNTIDAWRVNGNSTDLFLNWQSSGHIKMVTGGGNVLIGTTEDDGSKLKINGGITATQVIKTATAIVTNFYGNATCGLYPNTWIAGDGVNNRLWLYNDHNLALYGALIELRNNTSLTGQLNITFAKNATDPVEQAIVINSADYASTYAAWPGIGFHIPGSTYATIKFGSDTCFHFMNYTLSGWVDVKVGNLIATGGGAFGSDIRYKDITSYRQLDLETIVKAPLFSFRWTDREDKVEHLGTSAQYWLDTQFKDAVNTANKDFFHLDYGALAVGIGISVAREVKGVKTEVQLLREKVNQLEQELAQYRRS